MKSTSEKLADALNDIYRLVHNRFVYDAFMDDPMPEHERKCEIVKDISRQALAEHEAGNKTHDTHTLPDGKFDTHVLPEDRAKAWLDFDSHCARVCDFGDVITDNRISKKTYETIRAALQQPAPEVVTVSDLTSFISMALFNSHTQDVCHEVARNFKANYPNGVIVKGGM